MRNEDINRIKSIILSNVTNLRTDDEFNIHFDRVIEGVYNSYTVFLTDNEIDELMNNEESFLEIVNEVIHQLNLYDYSLHFYRLNPLNKGTNNFLYYPVLNIIYACSVRGYSLLKESTEPVFELFRSLFLKSLSVLSLVENNLFDDAYPILRTALELFTKIIILDINNKELLDKYFEFVNFQTKKAIGEDYGNKFNVYYKNRKYPQITNRQQYLSYGWVDFIPDYDKYIKRNSYSFESILEYVNKKCKAENDDISEQVRILNNNFKFCHPYSHSANHNSNNNYHNYINITNMLAISVMSAYLKLCYTYQVDPSFNNVDIVTIFNRQFDIFKGKVKRI